MFTFTVLIALVLSTTVRFTVSHGSAYTSCITSKRQVAMIKSNVAL